MEEERNPIPPRIERILESAILAPSSHNTQPWLFEIGDGCLRIHADRIRALPVNDPDDRELVISCGCALMNLRVAAAREGFATEVSLPTGTEDEDLLAEVRLIEGGDPDPAALALFPSIGRRQTYRKRFEDRPVDQATTERLVAAATAEGAHLHVVADEAERRQVAELVAEGDASQWDDPRWRRELAAWMHPRRTGEGLTLPGLVAPVARAVVRTFDMGRGVAAKDSQLADQSPLIAVVWTGSDDQVDRLRAGQALERVLLTGCADGLQASYLNQPVQVPALRPRLGSLLGLAGRPQVVLRLGYPREEDLPPSPRREVRSALLR